MLQELEELTCIIHKCLVINENLAVGMINSSISISFADSFSDFFH